MKMKEKMKWGKRDRDRCVGDREGERERERERETERERERNYVVRGTLTEHALFSFVRGRWVSLRNRKPAIVYSRDDHAQCARRLNGIIR